MNNWVIGENNEQGDGVGQQETKGVSLYEHYGEWGIK